MTASLAARPAGEGRASPPTVSGLTSAEAAARAAAGESNDFRPSTSRTYRDILRDNLVNPFNVTLALLIAVLVAMGQAGDSLFSAFAVVVNTAVALVQEIRAKRQLDGLARLAERTATVLRDGAVTTIAERAIVLGDVVTLLPGDRIPVDGSTAMSDALEVSESLISGESEPVAKAAGDPLTSGSYVVAGSGALVAERVGAASFVNSLGVLASRTKFEHTPLQRKVDAIVEVSVLVMCLFAPLHLIASLRTSAPAVEVVRNAITLVTTFVPQGLVLATTVALTFGAIRISRHHTLVQRLNAVESMANVTVLCLDKTGTLTENRLQVVGLVPLAEATEDDLSRALARHVELVSAPNATIDAIGRAVAHGPETPAGRRDPRAAPTDPRNEHHPASPAKAYEVPFTSARKWGAIVGDDGRVTLLGAPELLIDGAGLATARQLAATGRRVVALGTAAAADAMDALAAGVVPRAVDPLGLVVIQDRIRPGIRDVLRDLAGQGIALKVISGDSPETVRAIAAEAGIEAASVATGSELLALPEAAFGAAVRDGVLFARITPELKRRIVLRLREAGEYVAMVGDGVNDVPALKAARLGIAMRDGAQMAREVSELVLLDNDIGTLPRALDEGRTTIEKAYATCRIFLSKNFSMVLLFIMAGYAQLPFPGQVREVSWATMVVAAFPVTLIAFDLVKPKPVRRFVRNVVGYVLVVGTVGAVAFTAAYAFAFEASGRDLGLARSFMIVVAIAYGILVFWDTCGISPIHPRTMRRRSLAAAVGAITGVVGVAAPQLLPGLFSATVLPPAYWLALVALVAALLVVFPRFVAGRVSLTRPLRSMFEGL